MWSNNITLLIQNFVQCRKLGKSALLQGQTPPTPHYSGSLFRNVNYVIMPVITDRRPTGTIYQPEEAGGTQRAQRPDQCRRQTQHSSLARSAIMGSRTTSQDNSDFTTHARREPQERESLAVLPKAGVVARRSLADALQDKLENKPFPPPRRHGVTDGVGVPLSDTPATSAPPSPKM